MPGASMLTKVIIMAASGKAGLGSRECGSSAQLEGDSPPSALEGQGLLELRGALLHIGDAGLVAVMAVGDDELFVGHGGDDEVDEVRVR